MQPDIRFIEFTDPVLLRAITVGTDSLSVLYLYMPPNT